MESLEANSKLEIPINKIFYNKVSKIISIEISGFTFIGQYKKSTRIKEILDDILEALPKIKIERDKICILDATHLPVPETIKLKDLKVKERIIIEEKEKKEDKEEKQKKGVKRRAKVKRDMAKPIEEKISDETTEEYDYTDGEREIEKSELRRIKDEDLLGGIKEKEVDKKRAGPASLVPKTPPPAPGGGPDTGVARSESTLKKLEDDEIEEEIEFDDEGEIEDNVEAKPTRYDINMGFQYYSVMMEQQSYLFYVYFSFKELIIKDEEGKTVYKTRFTIVTTKEEPPILDLRIEGEGFEVHPLSGKVEVKKKFLNPPVMIFSILPVKSKIPKKKKKEGEKRFLHVYINFEGKDVSHSILSITVQPKHFHLDLGPLHFDLTKTQAMFISVISILITITSVAYSLFTLDVSGPTTDIITGIIPGIGGLLFFSMFIYTLFKEGVYPIQQQISSLLNFDKGITTLK